VTTQARSQCDTCARFRSPLDDGTPPGVTGPYCAAFPDGIPQRVFRNQVDHRASIKGDHGLRWEFKGEEFPEWAFPDPTVLKAPPAEQVARERAAQRIVSDYPLELEDPT
jgi:hypothetical protein